jgi:transposase-like protein
MQMLHPFGGSIQQYQQELSDADRYRPRSCPQCEAKRPLIAHGFYNRSLQERAFDGMIRVRRYLCRYCRRTVSLLPAFALPYLRSSTLIIALFLVARLLHRRTLFEAAAVLSGMAYQRGQFWIRRFRQQAEALCGALAGIAQPVAATNFVERALRMLENCGWIEAHRFLFGSLRFHLLGWPPALAPNGLRVMLSSGSAPT